MNKLDNLISDLKFRNRKNLEIPQAPVIVKCKPEFKELTPEREKSLIKMASSILHRIDKVKQDIGDLN